MNQLNLELREPISQNRITSQEKEREKIHLELFSRHNTRAMDVMGLSWLFVEDDEI